MGLDVYVGTLTRYYTGDWETIVQQAGREGGFQVEVRRPDAPRGGWLSRVVDRLRPKGPAAAARAVERWRRALSKKVAAPLDWSEAPDQEYFTDKPAWDGYGALLLWAAYDELPTARRAGTAVGWDSDPAYLTALQLPDSRYRHLLGDTEIWVPADFRTPVRTRSVTGDEVTVGSSVRLLAALDELNRRTWKADVGRLLEWRGEGAGVDAPLETAARFGFAVLHSLARKSVEHRLPMKLDY